jgi:hypothetical protein
VVSGDESQQLSRVVGAVTLSDGGIVVLDGDSRELRFFDASGAHQLTVGGRGEGPGEFRFPGHLSRMAGDTLRVLDMASDRHSFFAPDGAFLRAEPAPWTSEAGASADTAGADPFPTDDWVYGWNWISSPLPPGDRGGVVAALAAIPPADTTVDVRRVVVTDDGMLWTTSSAELPDSPAAWSIYHPDGRLVATLETPARFRPFEIASGHILGVRLDALDVEFVTRFGLDRRANGGRTPGLAALRGRGPAVYPVLPEEAFEEIRLTQRSLATLQEIYYSNNYGYTANWDSLEATRLRYRNGALAPMPASLRSTIVVADERGWVGIFMHRPSGTTCAVGSGASGPPGWSDGRLRCPGG